MKVELSNFRSARGGAKGSDIADGDAGRKVEVIAVIDNGRGHGVGGVADKSPDVLLKGVAPCDGRLDLNRAE